MAGIGEASAVLAFVELGFSFASALAKYTRDYQKAASEIGGLPAKLEETVGLISDLQGLLVQNETTHCWTDAGVKRAHQNVKDCEQILRTLQTVLLKEEGIPPNKVVITLEDLELSIVTKATWPLKYKPTVDDAKKGLDKLYNRISVTILTYSVQMSKERTSKAGLEKELARLLYQETRGHTKNKGKQRRGTQQSRAPVKPVKSKKRALSTLPYRGGRARSLSSSSANDSDRDDRTRIEAICAALKDLARAEVLKETEKIEAEEKRAEAMRAQAVTEWQTKFRAQVEEQNRRRDNLRQELSQRLESSAIDEVIKSVFPLEVGLDQGSGNVVAAVTSVSQGTNQQQLSVAGPAQRRRKPLFGGLFSRKQVRQPELDVELREMVSPAGKASLRGFTIAYDSERFIHCIQMGAPQQVFLERLLPGSDKKRSKQPTRDNTPWQEYAMLPAKFKARIAKEQKSLGAEWLLVHVERVFEPTVKKIFKESPQQLRGVYVIFRHQRSGYKPDNVSKDNLDQAGGKADSIASGTKDPKREQSAYIPPLTGQAEPSFEQRVADALHGRSKVYRPPSPEGGRLFGEPMSSYELFHRQRNPSRPPVTANRHPSMTRRRADSYASPARPSYYPSYFGSVHRVAQPVQNVIPERSRKHSKAYRQGRTVDLSVARRMSNDYRDSRYDTSYDDSRPQRGRRRRRTIRFESPRRQRRVYEITSDDDYSGRYDGWDPGRQANSQQHYHSRRLSMGEIHRSPSPMSSTSSIGDRQIVLRRKTIQRLESEVARSRQDADERRLREAEERSIQDRMKLEAQLAEAGMSTFDAEKHPTVSSSEPQVAATTFAMEEPAIRLATGCRSPSPYSPPSHSTPEARVHASAEPIADHSRRHRRRTTSASSSAEEAASPDEVTRLLSELTTGPIRPDRAARYEVPPAPSEQVAAGVEEHDLGAETSAKHADKYKPPEVE